MAERYPRIKVISGVKNRGKYFFLHIHIIITFRYASLNSVHKKGIGYSEEEIR